MRAMLTFRIPPEEGNAGSKDGRFTPTLQSIMEEQRKGRMSNTGNRKSGLTGGKP